MVSAARIDGPSTSLDAGANNPAETAVRAVSVFFDDLDDAFAQTINQVAWLPRRVYPAQQMVRADKVDITIGTFKQTLNLLDLFGRSKVRWV